MPGRALDLRLVVQTKEVDGKRYVVLLDDFKVTRITTPDASGTLLSNSKLGTRFQAAVNTSGLSDFTVNLKVEGVVFNNPGIQFMLNSVMCSNDHFTFSYVGERSRASHTQTFSNRQHF